jgi:hypothetical protein
MDQDLVQHGGLRKWLTVRPLCRRVRRRVAACDELPSAVAKRPAGGAKRGVAPSPAGRIRDSGKGGKPGQRDKEKQPGRALFHEKESVMMIEAAGGEA